AQNVRQTAHKHFLHPRAVAQVTIPVVREGTDFYFRPHWKLRNRKRPTPELVSRVSSPRRVVEVRHQETVPAAFVRFEITPTQTQEATHRQLLHPPPERWPAASLPNSFLHQVSSPGTRNRRELLPVRGQRLFHSRNEFGHICHRLLKHFVYLARTPKHTRKWGRGTVGRGSSFSFGRHISFGIVKSGRRDSSEFSVRN
ncbi:hypothetical protein GNI_085080, partial [Gregarina niphandrodes]